MSEKHVFRLMLGDWSGDGHGIDTTYRIQSNKPIEEVRAAYFSALEQTGLDLTEEVCAEYEDNVITEEMVSRLKGLGLPVPADREWVQTDEFVDLVLAYIKLGDPALELEVLPFEEMFQWNFGKDFKVLGNRPEATKRHIGFFGYGLFST